MPSKSRQYDSLSMPVPPYPSGGYVSPAPPSPASEIEDDTSDSPFFSNAEMELHAPVFNPKEEDAYQADEATAGFPGPYAFQTIVYEYLKGLSSKKREKALLNVTMYSAVMYVLNNPKDTSFKTAQFRFWAKKMFVMTEYEGDWVLTHDGKPVACREQMHGVLKHCHAIAGHGGRDKTSAEVRKFYSWIPKEIVARFVQMCPSCKSKRTLSSAALGVMSGSQSFLVNLQNTEEKLAQGKAITLAQAKAHAQSAMDARKAKAAAAAAVGQGRVHTVGSSNHPPQNAVNYGPTHYAPPQHYHPHAHDGSFGQSDFFHPPQHHMPPGTFSRSVSYDDTASRQFHQINEARRVSAPAFVAYAPNGVAYAPQYHEHQPTYIPMPPTHEADFDTLGDVRQACGSSAKQSLEEQHRREYSDNSQIDPHLAEYPYNPEYYGVQAPRFDRMPSGSTYHPQTAYYPTTQAVEANYAPNDVYEYGNAEPDHDSPLSVNELDAFSEVPEAEVQTHGEVDYSNVPFSTEDDEVYPDDLRRALKELKEEGEKAVAAAARAQAAREAMPSAA